MGDAALSLVNDQTDPPAWAELRQRVGQPVDRLIPVAARLQSLFPEGGLPRGSVVTVVGSTTIALSLVAQATQSGLWCAAVGMADLGAVAAAGIGVDLERFPLVPDPGADWPTVVSALIDGFDIVLMRTHKSLPLSTTRKLDARMRQRGSALVLLAPMPNVWSRTDYVLRESGVTYDGLGFGHGAITCRNFDIILEGRGAATRPRHTQLAV